MKKDMKLRGYKTEVSLGRIRRIKGGVDCEHCQNTLCKILRELKRSFQSHKNDPRIFLLVNIH